MPTHTGQHEVCLNKPENHPLSMQNRTSINLIFNHTCSCAFRISDSFLKDKIILQGSINLINRIFNALSFDIMKNDSISVEIPSSPKKIVFHPSFNLCCWGTRQNGNFLLGTISSPSHPNDRVLKCFFLGWAPKFTLFWVYVVRLGQIVLFSVRNHGKLDLFSGRVTRFGLEEFEVWSSYLD